MVSAVEYFRLWRSLGIGAMAGLGAGAVTLYASRFDGYVQVVLYSLLFIATVAALARLYVFRPLLVGIVGAVLLAFLYHGSRQGEVIIQVATLLGGGVIAGLVAVWVARPQHFGIALVLAWAACVIVGLPLTVL